MASFGNFDFSQLKNLQNKLNKLSDPDDFVDDCAKELAARLKAKVAKRTPVGDYSIEIEKVAKRSSKNHKKGDVYTKRINPSGKQGGTLRRGWEVGKIEQLGNTVYIEVSNPVEYASYVEYGHRTRNHNSWVPGKFMLKISAEEVQSLTPTILEGKIKKYLKEIFP